MIVSDTKKFIFIHIPKTAGMSIRNILAGYATFAEYQGRIPPGCTKQLNPRLHKHGRARDLIPALSRPWNTYFKFAFVRNPWDWLVSVYFYIRRDRRDSRHRLANRLTFKEFANWFSDQTPEKYQARAGQYDFICNKSGTKSIIDFVGKFETLAKDFSTVAKKIKIPGKLPHVNTTKHSVYTTYYDSATVDLVRRMFPKDIKVFNYEFKND